jgi:gamma-glutamylcysteine synthetase
MHFLRGGVEYVRVAPLDLDPFVAAGRHRRADPMRFIDDVFWCTACSATARRLPGRVALAHNQDRVAMSPATGARKRGAKGVAFRVGQP